MSLISNTDAESFLDLDAGDTLLGFVRPGIEAACKQYIGWDPERATATEYYPSTERGGEQFNWPGNWGWIDDTGGRSQILQLKRKWVLASGLLVYEYSGAYAGQFDETDWETLTLGDQYVLDLDDDNVSLSGHLKRLGVSWPKQRGSVKVTYAAGFTATELDSTKTGGTDYTDASDLRYAVLLAIAQGYNEAKAQQKNTGAGAAGPIVAESVPDYSYRRDTATAPMLLGMAAQLPTKVIQILDKYRHYGIVI